MSIDVVMHNLKEAQTVLASLIENQTALDNIVKAGDALAHSFSNGGQVISCGNGGSMCDAMHFAEEFTGRFRNNRRAIAAQAVSDPGFISCTANDFGYDQIFSRYVEAHGRKNDVLFGISTSGKSPNVINAAKQAKELGMTVIALTGRPDSEFGSLADIDICTPGVKYADRIQELHIKVIHTLIELVERKICPENYS